jgi:hypothetical protein
MAYKVLISAVAKKDLIRLPVPVGKAIYRELSTLAGELNPKIHVKKLKGAASRLFILYGWGTTGSSSLSTMQC